MITIRSGRHPLVIALMVVCVLSGVGNLATYSRSASPVIRLLPAPLGYAFFGVLISGAVVVLCGLALRTVNGPLLERVGYWLLAGLFVSYSVLAGTVAWPRSLFTASLLLGLGVGSLWRIVQIGRELGG